MQPLFSQPRPKRCATHCYIARNIHCLQQFMKMHPFWPPAAGTAPFFGAKTNLNVMPSADLHGNLAGRGASAGPDNKGQGLAIFPSNGGKDKVQPANIADAAQRKQQMLLQQALPPVAPNNLLVQSSSYSLFNNLISRFSSIFFNFLMRMKRFRDYHFFADSFPPNEFTAWACFHLPFESTAGSCSCCCSTRSCKVT